MKYIIKHSLLAVFVVLPLTLLGMIALAIVLPFIPKDQEILPRWCRWFDNYRGVMWHTRDPSSLPISDSHFKHTSNPKGVWGGLSGSTRERIAWYYDNPKGKWKRDPRGFVARYYWLAIRNPLNYFKYAVIGVPPQSQFRLNQRIYKPYKCLGDISDNKCPGWAYRYLVGHEQYMEYYSIRLYKKFFKGKCMRIRIGYKLDSDAELLRHFSNGLHVQWTFTISPFKTFRGKV